MVRSKVGNGNVIGKPAVRYRSEPFVGATAVALLIIPPPYFFQLADFSVAYTAST
ncbi:hypothetical protein LMG9673_03657 [Ralstonia pseudosolanacearum]|nr:hypothetical protein LMG9673_03657 [Ralstonia pseudosolanacearum]